MHMKQICRLNINFEFARAGVMQGTQGMLIFNGAQHRDEIFQFCCGYVVR